jgi:formylmethanofuran dehydrogenase subunit E
MTTHYIIEKEKVNEWYNDLYTIPLPSYSKSTQLISTSGSGKNKKETQLLSLKSCVENEAKIASEELSKVELNSYRGIEDIEDKEDNVVAFCDECGKAYLNRDLLLTSAGKVCKRCYKLYKED